MEKSDVVAAPTSNPTVLTLPHTEEGCPCDSTRFTNYKLYVFSIFSDHDYVVRVPPCCSWRDDRDWYATARDDAVAIVQSATGRILWDEQTVTELLAMRTERDEGVKNWELINALPEAFKSGTRRFFVARDVVEAVRKSNVRFARCSVCQEVLRKGKWGGEAYYHAAYCSHACFIADQDSERRHAELTELGKPSIVYFVEQIGLGHVKIGTSTREVAKRIAGLQTSVPLRVLGTIPGDARLERILHDRWQHLHIRGEWFFLTAELRAFIDAVLTTPHAVIGGDNGKE